MIALEINKNKLNVRIAASFFSRLRGLLFASPLQENEGLLIVPCHSVHTAWMRYAIDVVFIDRAGTVLQINAQLKPWRMAYYQKTGNKAAYQTLELLAGQAAKLGFSVGMTLALPNSQNK